MPGLITEDVNVFTRSFWLLDIRRKISTLLEKVNMDQQSFCLLVFTSAFLIICLLDDDSFLNENFTTPVYLPLLFRLDHFIMLE